MGFCQRTEYILYISYLFLLLLKHAISLFIIGDLMKFNLFMDLAKLIFWPQGWTPSTYFEAKHPQHTISFCGCRVSQIKLGLGHTQTLYPWGWTISTCYPLFAAGDLVKFNLPMAWAAHTLSWGLNKFKDGYQTAGQLDMMYDCLKWPLEYFLKCWRPNEQVYYAQVRVLFCYAYWMSLISDTKCI